MKFLTKSNSSNDDQVSVHDTGTIVGSSVKIIGDLISEGDVQIDGVLDGNIRALGTVVIGGSAQIKGQVSGRQVVVSGSVTADIVATEELHILASGKIFGNVQTKILGIEPGAVFVGKSEILSVEKEDQVLIGSANSDEEKSLE
ncbi:MAG: hypothetical protein Fur0024_0910 [Patescibacteria group bacterium]